ncbi:dynactin subunit 3 isoform X2 [Columba livia]|uniref:dynactin subunit 3 isoform X2 n=1 Tax=Columba livia TaxID=8932 RepID=UPI0031BBCD27
MCRHGNGEGRAGSGVRLVPAGGEMAAGAAELQRLQWRLEELEQRVGGGDGAGKVADELVKVQVALSNIAGKKERIKILFKKIEDVIKYLDPQYIDRMAVPDAMKLQFILAEEQVIPSRAALLEQVKNLQPILDSTSIQVSQGRKNGTSASHDHHLCDINFEEVVRCHSKKLALVSSSLF